MYLFLCQGSVGETGEAGDKGSPGEKGQPGQSTSNVGVVFTVWGQTDCPETEGTVRLIQGRMATSSHSNAGNGANYLCLPNAPVFSDMADPMDVIQATIAGVKYRTVNEPLQNVHNSVAPCSTCYTPQAVQLMIPGWDTCPSSSWRLEYNGYLMSSRDTPSGEASAGDDAHYRTEYVCVAANAISAPESSAGGNEAELYHVHIDCENGASLICSEGGYDSSQLRCAVCTLNPVS